MNRDQASEPSRIDYRKGALREQEAGHQPFALFTRWFDEACNEQAIAEPNGMTLATVGSDGRPSARIVLMKRLEAEELWFFTNFNSRKGHELDRNPHAAAVFWWQPMERQVRFEGRVERLSAAQSDAYFASRPHLAQCAAIASAQSTVLHDRLELEQRFATLAQNETAPPRPLHWGGYKLISDAVEFWQGRPDRLHDRLRFRRKDPGWIRERLSP